MSGLSETLIQTSTEVFPLTSTQRGILAASLLPRERGVYLEQIVCELDGPLDIGHFRSAWQHAVGAFDALRLAPRWAHGSGNQIIAASAEVPFHVADLSAHLGTRRARIEQFIERDRLDGFDLNPVHLMRVSVLVLDHSKWAFVWTIHPTIIDRGSFATVLESVFESYDRLSGGRSPAVPPGPPFRAFLKWLQEHEATAGIRHFETLLDGFHEPTRLPLQYGRSHFQTGRSDAVRCRLDAVDSQAIAAAARDSGTTAETLVQLAWGLLLSGYGDDDDVVFGVTCSGRPEAIERTDLLVGPCMSTLPIRVNVADASTVRGALRALRDQYLAMRPFQQTPLHAVKLAGGEGRQIFRTNVEFEYERFDAVLRRKDERWAHRKIWSRTLTNYPLNLSAYFDKGELALDLVYNVSVYSAQAANRLLTDYARLLKGIAHGLDAAPADLCLLESGLREALTTGEARREQVRPQPNPIERILRNGDECPEAVAVSEIDGRFLTYAELASRVLGLAEELREHGVTEGALIGILLPRSIDAIVSMLAVHAVGAAFLPLDPGDPPARLEYMVRDSQLARVLVNGETAGALKGAAELELRTDIAQNAPRAARSLSVPNPSDIAYVIYTSGSTGQPKGVCIPRSALAHHVASVTECFGLCRADRVLQFSSLNFDVSLEEILPTLAVGASLVLRSDEMTSSARSFFDIVERSAITVLNLPTSFWHYLVHAGPASWPSKVRLLIVGGERVSAADLRTFRQGKSEHIRFLNGYGPTETTITSTLYDDSEDDHDGETVPIGRPLSGFSHFALDQHLRPVPPGAVGQLYIGGAGLALGYLRREELTAQRFPTHPFRADARLYATGDLVRQTERGNYVFVDRIDHQIKLRGFRIELGEIEACLKQHAGVTEAVVVLHRPANGEPELRAFVLPRDQAVSAETLRQHVAAALPRHMVPRLLMVDELPKTPAGKIDRPAVSARDVPYSHEVTPSVPSAFAPVDALPLTPSGKLDRLAPPALDRRQRAVDMVPRTPVEAQLSTIWSQVLGIKEFGIDADFFEWGGHSLLAARLFTEIENVFGRRLPLATIIEAPTIARLAKVLEGPAESAPWSPIVTLQPEGSGGPLFLIHGIGGEVLTFTTLAHSLGPDQPVYGLRARGADGSQQPLPDVESMAAHYLEAIRTVAPHGPYHLGGYSSGGTLALEMAQQLLAQGEAVGLVAMIDAEAPGAASKWRLRHVPAFLRNMAYWAVYDDFLRSPPRYMLASVQSKLRLVRGHLVSRVTHRPAEVDVRDVMRVWQYPDRTRAFLEAQHHVLSEYKPREYPETITLIRARLMPLFAPPEYDLGWSRIAPGRVNVKVIAGAHDNILTEPRVHLVAAQVRASLKAELLRGARGQTPGA